MYRLLDSVKYVHELCHRYSHPVPKKSEGGGDLTHMVSP